MNFIQAVQDPQDKYRRNTHNIYMHREELGKC